MDRLGWTVGKTYVAYGAYFGVRSNSLEILGRVIERLPFGSRETPPRKVDTIFSFLHGGDSRPGSPIQRFNLIYRNEQRIARVVGQVDSLIDQLQSDMQLCIAERAQTRLFIHAGVVGWEGKAIVIPGHSQSGKSTLVREFIKAGATYYSDEYALFDKRNLVHPFSRALQMRHSTTFETQVLTPEELGAVVGTKPLPVGMVLLPQYVEGKQWLPKRLCGGKAILKILRHCVSIRLQPAAYFKVLDGLVESAPVFVGNRGQASDVLHWFLAESRKKPG